MIPNPKLIRNALLVLLVLVGGVLRLYDVNWDQFQNVHPDERFIVWVADTVSWPESLTVALDPLRSTINPFRWPPDDPASGALNSLAGQPRNYAYGHFPLYLLVATAHLAQGVATWLGETTLAFPAAFQPLHTVGRHLASYHYLPLVGRVLSAVADLGTLLLVYALARMLMSTEGSTVEHPDRQAAVGSRRVRSVLPLLVAGAYALAVLPIQLSHYVAVDALLTFFVTATVALAARCAAYDIPLSADPGPAESGASHCRTHAAVRHQGSQQITDENGWRSTPDASCNSAQPSRERRHPRPIWLLSGIMAGLAVGSKFSAVLLVLPLIAAALYHLPQSARGQQAIGALGVRLALRIPAGFGIVVKRLAAVGGVALLVFIVTNPFAIIEFGSYVRQIASQNAMVSGIMDAPYTRQYIGALPYLYFIQQLSQWGLGWPLGVVAWGGLVWAVVQFGRRRASPALTVMLAWALPYFAITGAFHTKFLRYMAPLLPFLLAFGAAAALDAYRALARRWGIRGRVTWASGVVIIAASTMTWALTFLGAYRQEHPWIQASRWIFQNIPAGDKLLTEHWDDALPLTLDELPGGRPPQHEYTRVELPLWEPDTAEKLDLLVAELSTADYIILSSNRLSAPMQRLSVRYPMTSQYYRLLFAGDLGYQPVVEFTAYPRLGGFVVRDDRADESFSVYDHPHVVVLENVGRLTPSLLRARLGRYLPLGIRPSDRLTVSSKRVPGLARMLPQAPAPDAPLTLAQPVDTLPVVADFRWNRVASEMAPIAVVLWWLVIGIFGWAAWPLLFPLLGSLKDRGYGLARAAGWLLVGWVHWFGVSLGAWQNRLGSLAVVLAGLVLLGLVAWVAQRRQMRVFWAARRRLLLGQELLFAVAYLAFVGVRLLNPDLWQPWNGGEKFMEFAFLNAILRSPFFPPYDPYFAGGIINYYYYGLYLVSLPIKLTGIFSEVAFNLAVPSLFALTAVGVFSVTYSLAGEQEYDGVGGWSAGWTALASVGLALLMGNLRGLRWLWDGYISLLRGAAWPSYDYWGASRVIPYTINEFPLWTFTFADLHPHMIAMPFGVLVIGLALNWLLGRGSRVLGAEDTSRTAVVIPKVALLVLALGALGAINTWDLPTYTLLVAAVFLVIGWRARGWRALIGGVGLAAITAVLAVAAYWPFYAHYRARVGGESGPVIGRFLAWTREASPMDDWLNVWGFFLFLALSYVVVAWIHGRGVDAGSGAGSQQAETSVERGRPWLAGLLGLIAVLALLAAAGRPTAALAALPLCLVLPLVFRRWSGLAEAFTALLLGLGLGIVAGIELIYLRDFLEGGEWYRMNTLFKFSVPAWLLLSVAGGPMLRRLWGAASRAPRWVGIPWQMATTMLLAVGLVFLAAGIRTRVNDRFPGARPAIGTLDGTAYMTVGRYTWPSADTIIALNPERDAIRWLLENVTGTPVIAEAPAGGYDVAGQFLGYDYYRAGGLRVASLTGFPTFVGHHQGEQRPGDQVGPRTELGREFFETTDLARSRALSQELRVGYVYIGQLERILFSADALRKFDVLTELGDLAVVYRNSDVTIYQVVR